MFGGQWDNMFTASGVDYPPWTRTQCYIHFRKRRAKTSQRQKH